MDWTIAVAVVVGLAVIYAVWTFNRLVSLKTRAENAWSDIDVQLRRRWDLVPRLVETVRGYTNHEKQTLEDVTAARSQAQQKEGPGERGRAESDLTNRVHRLIAVVEDYPDLKADDLFRSLHTEIVAVEDSLQAARRYYNAVVRDLNTLIAQFPSSLVAMVTARKPLEFFELDSPAEARAPMVSMKDDE